MTEEEMAVEWVEKKISLGTSMYNPQIEHYCKKAFLAGLKAGKPQWHKVKSGDLPPEDTKVLAFMAGGEVCIAHFYRKNVWDKIGIVIAWKEIVLPKEIKEND